MDADATRVAVAGALIMLPLFVGGVFIAGLLWLEKLTEPERWKNRDEEKRYHQEREKWVDDTVFWNIRR